MNSALRRTQISVIGAAHASPALLAEAETLGRLLVEAGFRVITGGLGGVMEAVSRGARAAAGETDGRVIGILPGDDAAAANEAVDVAIPTGLGYARNVIVVASGDVVVAVGGRSGTLSEIALAWQAGKPLIALDTGEGWSSRLADQAIDDKRDDRLYRATSARGVVDRIEALLAPQTG